MEEVLSRFPHIGEDIFKELGGKDFFKSMEVSRSWNFFIKNQKVLQNAYKTHKANKKRVQEKIQILTKEIRWYGRKKTPFHLAAERGYLAVCQQIMETTVDKNPEDWVAQTPLHKAAENGHFSVCQEIMEYANDKNPKDCNGFTPFHKAAENGHSSVCQLILENVDDKNPKSNSGWTPLHLAAQNGHLSVCQLIVENVDDKNPKSNNGWTPLDLAETHVGIKKLIENAMKST